MNFERRLLEERREPVDSGLVGQGEGKQRHQFKVSAKNKQTVSQRFYSRIDPDLIKVLMTVFKRKRIKDVLGWDILWGLIQYEESN